MSKPRIGPPWNLAKRAKVPPLWQLPTTQLPAVHLERPQAHASTTTSAAPRVQPIRFKRKESDLPSPPTWRDVQREQLVRRAQENNITVPADLQTARPFEKPNNVTLPRNVTSLYMAPLRRRSTHGIVVCDLQIRSYLVRHVEFMADFALRAAYYLNLPAKGPVPLPRITERWTVPRSPFIFKKSQQNFERITLRRLVQIQDGHPEAVRRWLNFIRKNMWYGVGMKANVYEWEDLDVVKRMDEDEKSVDEGIEAVDWDLFGVRQSLGDRESMNAMLAKEGFPGKHSRAASSPSIAEK